MTKILEGKLLSQEILDSVKQQIELLKQAKARIPALAVILVGNDSASNIYVRNKKNACDKVGIKSIVYRLSSNTTQDVLLKLIHKLNADSEIDGILVQLPLPKHLDSKIITNSIRYDKDVDGLHPYNMGTLAINHSLIRPCTPHGIMCMLDSINFSYQGSNAVVIGSSNIVGRPMALELLNRGATVTICNSKTKDISLFSKIADLIIIAVGKPKFLKKEQVKKGVIIVDVGINRLPDNSICGDADFNELLDIVQYITPVPGGVGPMTIAMLMANTISCYTLSSSNSVDLQ